MLGFRLVKDDQVGIVTKNMFGKKMPQGQIIATDREIGVQADILMPGLYWRMPIIYKIEKVPVTRIEQGNIGIVESIDGKPIPSGRLLGDEVDCNSFQDARAFLENGGCKGPQVAVLRPGTYRINDQVFKVRVAHAVNVPTEKVGVVTAQDGIPLPSGYIVAPSPEGDSQHFQDGQAFIDSGGFRGTQLETLQPGEYYINPLLFSVISYDVATVPPGYVGMTVEEIRQHIGADTLGYLSLQGLLDSVGMADKREVHYCRACFTGNYPVPVQLEMDKLVLEVPAAPGPKDYTVSESVETEELLAEKLPST
jgi:hypothetical protein